MSTERRMLAVVSLVLDLVLSSTFILSSQAAPSPLATTDSVGFFFFFSHIPFFLALSSVFLALVTSSPSLRTLDSPGLSLGSLSGHSSL